MLPTFLILAFHMSALCVIYLVWSDVSYQSTHCFILHVSNSEGLTSIRPKISMHVCMLHSSSSSPPFSFSFPPSSSFLFLVSSFLLLPSYFLLLLLRLLLLPNLLCIVPILSDDP